MHNSINLLINNLFIGGAEGVCVSIANELNRRGWLIKLVLLNDLRMERANQLSSDIAVTVLGCQRARQSLPAIIRYLNSEKPEQLLVFNFQISILMLMIRPFLNCKPRIHSRCINTLSFKIASQNAAAKAFLLNKLVSIVYSRSDTIIAQSESMAEDLVTNYGIERSRIRVIYNPVGKIMPSNGTKNAYPKYILFVGRLDQQKNLDLALESFRILQRRIPDLRFKIVGDGDQRQHLESLANSMGIGANVDFEGFQANPAPYYRDALATVLTSHYEGFPNVLVESVSHGTPVVSVDCPSGPSEIICPGVNGFLVPNYDPHSLSDSLQFALAQGFDAGDMHKSLQRFDIGTVIAQYESVFNSS